MLSSHLRQSHRPLKSVEEKSCRCSSKQLGLEPFFVPNQPKRSRVAQHSGLASTRGHFFVPVSTGRTSIRRDQLHEVVDPLAARLSLHRKPAATTYLSLHLA